MSEIFPALPSGCYDSNAAVAITGRALPTLKGWIIKGWLSVTGHHFHNGRVCRHFSQSAIDEALRCAQEAIKTREKERADFLRSNSCEFGKKRWEARHDKYREKAGPSAISYQQAAEILSVKKSAIRPLVLRNRIERVAPGFVSLVSVQSYKLRRDGAKAQAAKSHRPAPTPKVKQLSLPLPSPRPMRQVIHKQALPLPIPRAEPPAYIRREWAIPSSVSTGMGRYDAEEQGRTAAIARSRSIFYLASRYVPGGIEWRYQDTMQDSDGWEVREQVLKNGARWESCPVAHPSVGAREGSLYNAPRRIA